MVERREVEEQPQSTAEKDLRGTAAAPPVAWNLIPGCSPGGLQRWKTMAAGKTRAWHKNQLLLVASPLNPMMRKS